MLCYCHAAAQLLLSDSRHSLLCDALSDLARAALAAILRQFLGEEGTKKLFEALERLGKFIGNLFGALETFVSNPFSFVANLVSGFGEGFSRFAQGFPENVLSIAVKWVLNGTNGLSVDTLPKQLTWPSMLGWMLGVAGLSPSKIETRLRTQYDLPPVIWNWLQQRLGSGGGSTDSPGPKLWSDIQEFGKSVDGLDLNVEALQAQVQKQIPKMLQEWAIKTIKTLPEELLFSGGGIGRLVKFATFVAKEYNHILELGETFAQALVAAGDKNEVANRVESGLGQLTLVLLKLVESQFKTVGTFRKSVQDFTTKIICRVQDKVDSFISWLLRKGAKECKVCAARKKAMGGKPAPGKKCGQCFAGDTAIWLRDGVQSDLVSVKLGDRVLTWLPGEYGYPSSCMIEDTYVNPLTCLVYWFLQEYEGGYTSQATYQKLQWS